MNQIDEIMESTIVIEELNVVSNTEQIVLVNADKNKIMHSLQSNLQEKQNFLLSNTFNQFQQILVVSQITINFSNDNPFFSHITMIVKAIRKAIQRRLIVETNLLESKNEFLIKSDQLFRVFYQDINIGFITSTGQIKSTAFIFLHRDIIGYLNKRMLIDLKKQRVKILVNFFNIIQFQKQPQQHQDYKQQFIQTNKFRNNFFILNEDYNNSNNSYQYHVYRFLDDQIYYIKKFILQSNEILFQDIFQTIPQKIDSIKIQEARIVFSISHPNIIRVYDWWIEYQNNSYELLIQLEYCTYPGYIQQVKNLLSYSYFYMNPMQYEQKNEKISSILNQILDVLQYLETKNIIHGDLKPESIMITTHVNGNLQIVLDDLKSIGKITKQNKIKSMKSIGVLLMHLILTFPGEPTLRNSYISKFQSQSLEDSLIEFDKWAHKHIKNCSRDFSFIQYKNYMQLAKGLLQGEFHELHEIRMLTQNNQLFHLIV